MPPRKNVAPSNAVRQFWCDICSKGYPRQPDYENHLRSYDHNHRQRNLDTNKLMARKEAEGKSEKKRGLDEMRSVPVSGVKKGPGAGPRFTKVGGAVGGEAGSRFKKVGVTISDSAKKEGSEESKTVGTAKNELSEEDALAKMMKQQEELRKRIEALREKKKMDAESPKPEPARSEGASLQKPTAVVKDEDVAMREADAEEESPKVEETTEVDSKASKPKADAEVITWEQYDFTHPTHCDHANCPGRKTDGVWDDLDKFLED